MYSKTLHGLSKSRKTQLAEGQAWITGIQAAEVLQQMALITENHGQSCCTIEVQR
jgi:hypothetical protein